MSRIRSIHPGLWTDEVFVSLGSFARLLFMGMWNECDDKGTFPWSPLQMKMRILPADNVDAGALMAELEAAGCIMKYEIAGKAFGAVRNFAKFQRPKAPNDIHPATPEALVFAGHEPVEAVTDTPEVPKDFPNASEKPPQMEEGEEEEGEEEVSPDGDCASDDALTIDHVFDHWNAEIAPLGKKPVRKRNPERRQLVKARIGQNGLDEFLEVFANIRASPFLLEAKGLQFDWFMKKQNFTKVLEGNYNG